MNFREINDYFYPDAFSEFDVSKVYIYHDNSKNNYRYILELRKNSEVIKRAIETIYNNTSEEVFNTIKKVLDDNGIAYETIQEY